MQNFFSTRLLDEAEAEDAQKVFVREIFRENFSKTQQTKILGIVYSLKV